LAAVAADPESGRIAPAVDAQLDGVRQRAGRGGGAPPAVRGGRGGPVLAGRHGRGRQHVRGELPSETIAAWPASRVRPVGFVLGSRRLSSAGWGGPAARPAADADEVHDGLASDAGVAAGWRWRQMSSSCLPGCGLAGGHGVASAAGTAAAKARTEAGPAKPRAAPLMKRIGFMTISCAGG